MSLDVDDSLIFVDGKEAISDRLAGDRLPPDRISQMLKESYSVIAGSYPLQVVGDFKWESDIDIWIPDNGKGFVIFRTLMDLGYAPYRMRITCSDKYVKDNKRDSMKGRFENNIVNDETCEFDYLRLNSTVKRMYVFKKNGMINIQLIVLMDGKDVNNVIKNFDVSVCQIAYDGEKVYSTEDTIKNQLRTRRTTITRSAIDSQSIYEWLRTLKRMIKYTVRGFSFDREMFTNVPLLQKRDFKKSFIVQGDIMFWAGMVEFAEMWNKKANALNELGFATGETDLTAPIFQILPGRIALHMQTLDEFDQLLTEHKGNINEIETINNIYIPQFDKRKLKIVEGILKRYAQPQYAELKVDLIDPICLNKEGNMVSKSSIPPNDSMFTFWDGEKFVCRDTSPTNLMITRIKDYVKDIYYELGPSGKVDYSSPYFMYKPADNRIVDANGLITVSRNAAQILDYYIVSPLQDSVGNPLPPKRLVNAVQLTNGYVYGDWEHNDPPLEVRVYTIYCVKDQYAVTEINEALDFIHEELDDSDDMNDPVEDPDSIILENCDIEGEDALIADVPSAQKKLIVYGEHMTWCDSDEYVQDLVAHPESHAMDILYEYSDAGTNRYKPYFRFKDSSGNRYNFIISLRSLRTVYHKLAAGVNVFVVANSADGTKKFITLSDALVGNLANIRPVTIRSLLPLE